MIFVHTYTYPIVEKQQKRNVGTVDQNELSTRVWSNPKISEMFYESIILEWKGLEMVRLAKSHHN